MGYPVTDFRKAGTDYLWVRFRDGRQSTADSYLVSKFSAHATRPWGASRIGTGIADMIVTARLDREQFKNFPGYTFVGRGMRLYDIRDGAQVENDPSTHLFTRNNSVIAWNILRGIKAYWAGGGSEWMFGPQAVALAHLPTSAWVAAMNACDESFDRAGGGSEPQFSMGGAIACDRQPAEVLVDIFASAAGFLADVGYGFKPKIGAPSASVLTFDDGQIVVTSKQGYEPFAGLEASHNAITGQYSEPALGHAMKDLPRRVDAAALAEDDNQLLVDEVQYPLVHSGPTAQRLMAARLADKRLWRRHQLALGHGAALLEPVDVVAWNSARNGYSAKNFELQGGVQISRALVPSLAMKETDSGAWDWNEATDELASPVTPLTPATAPSQPMSGWSVAASSLPAEGGGSPRPAIRVTYAGELDDVRAVQVQVRLAATGALVFDGDKPYDPAVASPAVDLDSVFAPNTAYEARGKFIPFSARPTEWSGWLAVTTGDQRLGGGDLFDAIIDHAKLADGVNARFDWGGAQAVSTQQLLEQLAVDIAEGRLGAHFDAHTREQRVSAVAENARAETVRLDLAIADETAARAAQINAVEAEFDGALATVNATLDAQATTNSATADLIETLTAAFGGNEAQVLMRFQATAGSTGADAAYTLQLKTLSGGTWYSIGDIWEIVGGVGRRITIADQWYLMLPDGTVVAAFGPDGKLLVDRLSVSVLSALSANLGTVTAGIIQSSDESFVINLTTNTITLGGKQLISLVGGQTYLNVDLIESGSLTETYPTESSTLASSSGPLAVHNTSGVVTLDGVSLFVAAQATMTLRPDPGEIIAANVYLQVSEDGGAWTTVNTEYRINPNYNQNVSMVWLKPRPSGTAKTYQVRLAIQRAIATGTVEINTSTIVVQHNKR
jgi:hypothetical protein